MKRFGRYLFVFVVVFGLFASAGLYAGENYEHECTGHGHAGKGDWKGEEWEGKIYKDLKLTEGQKKLLEENKKACREKAKASFEKMKALKAELNQALMQKDLDMDKINQIQSQVKAIHAEMVDDRLNSTLEIKKILTPEQFTQFISSAKKHKNKKWKAHKNKGIMTD